MAINRGLPRERQRHRESVTIFNAGGSDYSESAFVVPEFDVVTGEKVLNRADIPYAEVRSQVSGFGSGQTVVDFRVRPVDFHRAAALLDEAYNG